MKLGPVIPSFFNELEKVSGIKDLISKTLSAPKKATNEANKVAIKTIAKHPKIINVVQNALNDPDGIPALARMFSMLGKY